MRVPRPLHLVLLLAAASGCSLSPRVRYPWPSLAPDFKQLAQRYPQAPAVILREDDRYALTLDRSGEAPWQVEHVEAIAILSESGERYANVAVPVGDATLVSLDARTITPDGEIKEVQPQEVHELTANTGGVLDSRSSSVKVFRLPDVRAGSVVEYAYTVRGDRILTSFRAQISRDIPLERYHLEYEASMNVSISFRFYNWRPLIRQDSDGLRQRAFVEYQNVPAHRAELFAPPRTFTEPSWRMAVGRVRLSNRIWALYDTWTRALLPMFRRLYGHDWRLQSGPDLGDCAPRSYCALERALAWVGAKTELARFNDTIEHARALDKVLASGRADNFEKALLLYAALRQLKVPARFALVARDLERICDRTLPQGGCWDHLVLYVDGPAVDGTPLFIDPSCEWCRVGQIPPWIKHRDAFVLANKQLEDMTGSETAVQIVPVSGSDAVPAATRRHIDVQLDPATGAISGQIRLERSGSDALNLRIETRDWPAARWRRMLESELHERSQTAQLIRHTAASWDKQRATSSVVADYAAGPYAVADGDRFIIPFSLLHAWSDEPLSDEPRAHNVFLPEGKRDEETIAFHLPSGYAVAELPHSLVMHSDSLDAALSVTASADTVMVRRTIQTHAGQWGPEEFGDLADLLRRLASLRREAFVLKKVELP